MTVTLAMALLLQLAAVTLLRLRLGRTWLRRPTMLLVLTSVAYEGISPLLGVVPSIARWDAFTTGVQRSYTDDATLIMSAAMLAFTLAYLVAPPGRTAPEAPDTAAITRALDWRMLACGCVPLAVLTYAGHGYNSGGPAIGAGASAGAVLASGFFVLLTALTAVSFLIRHGTRFFLPVLAVQSLILAAAGERAPVVAAAIILIVLPRHADCRLPGRQVGVAIALTACALLAITGARAAQGRAVYHQDSGVASRVSALAQGITANGTGSGTAAQPGFAAQAASRLDGTSFAGAVLQSVSMGQSRLSAAGVPESVLLLVPSVLWPSKLSHAVALNPTVAEIDDFGLQQVNFLPTLPGLYMGFLSPPWLIALLAFLGLLVGWAERWLLCACTPARLVMLAGAVNAALWYEQGLPGMIGVLRSAVVLALAVKVFEVARGRNSVRAAHHLQAVVGTPLGE